MMGGRKQKLREPKSGIYIIGEGITEQYYFTHIKKLYDFHCTIKPRFFGNTSIVDMKKKIKELLRENIFVICVFDTDVFVDNESEYKKLEQLQNQYRKNKNLLFCKSFPSIEYWFLLHYENTNRPFNHSKEVETALKKYMINYEKKSQFLEKAQWVSDLCAEGKLNKATIRAKHFKQKDSSYTNVNEAIDVLMKTQ